MKTVVRFVGICLSLLACFALNQSARAISYTFSQTGWDGGGEITGTVEMDESIDSGIPGVVSRNGVVSLHAHWSGNQYSQPFDWDENDLGWFLWNIGNPQGILEMVLGEFSAPVFYDESLKILWDSRSSAVYNWHPEDPPELRTQYRTETRDGITGHVPDGGSTLLLLGAALACMSVAKAFSCVSLRRSPSAVGEGR